MKLLLDDATGLGTWIITQHRGCEKIIELFCTSPHLQVSDRWIKTSSVHQTQMLSPIVLVIDG